MQGIVLAAGEGTRLRPRTADKPKPLVEVAGEPILSHCFETLLDIGLTDAVVVVGYEHEQIRRRYGASYEGLDIEYAYQPERLGLAHAVRMAEAYVESDCVVLNGDNVYNANLDAVVEHHRTTGADITFPVDEVSPDVATEGAVCRVADDGTVTGLVEKPETPPSTLVPAACYVLPPAIFDACRVVRPSERGEYELPAAVDLLIHAGYEVATVPFEGWTVNVNTEADIERAERKLADAK